MDERQERTEPTGGRQDGAAADAWAYLAWCPNCGERLVKLQCKTRCFRCGFFQDCGDTIV